MFAEPDITLHRAIPTMAAQGLLSSDIYAYAVKVWQRPRDLELVVEVRQCPLRSGARG